MENEPQDHAARLTPEQWFAMNMRERRTRQGHSQAEFAKMLDERGLRMSQQTLQKIESGARPIKLNEAHVIAECLEQSLEDMMNDLGSDVLGDLLEETETAIHDATGALTVAYEKQERLASILDLYERAGWSVERPSTYTDQIRVTHYDIHREALRDIDMDHARVALALRHVPETLARYLEEQKTATLNAGPYRKLFFDTHPEIADLYEGDLSSVLDEQGTD